MKSSVHAESTLSWSSLRVHKRRDHGLPCSKYFRKNSSSPELGENSALLSDVSGSVQPGKILAVMGSSGVGKTTLLKTLSGQHDPTKSTFVSGQVMVDNRVTSHYERLTNSNIGHVEQDQVFTETLTIEEHLLFQAMLRLHSLAMTDEERRLRVCQTIDLFSLKDSASTAISHLSGGERKRLALATVALINPAIMLIDEPTSGLDSYLAKSIMTVIRMLAVEQRRSIVVVLHQPSAEMFTYIDLVCVLVSGGRQAFFGDAQREASLFFGETCQLNGTSLDGYIEQLSAPLKSASSEVRQVPDRFAASSYALSLATAASTTTTESPARLISSYPSFGRQIKWLLWRSFVAGGRNLARICDLLMKTLLPAIFFSLLYFNLPQRTPLSAYKQNIDAVLYLILNITGITCATLVSGTMPKSIAVFIKQKQQRMYTTPAFYLSSVLHDLIAFIGMPLVFVTLLYWSSWIVAGHDRALWHFLMVLAVAVLASNTTGAMGHCVAACSSTVESAASTIVVILQILLLFSGYFVDLRRIPALFHALQYVSPFYYAFSILQELQWHSDSPSFNKIYFDINMLIVLLIVFHAGAFVVIWFRGCRMQLIERFSSVGSSS